jgi:hypothetical protein
MKRFVRRAMVVLGIAGSFGMASSASAYDSFPPSGDELVGQQPLPSQTKYFEEHAANPRTTRLTGDSFPPSDELVGQQPLPSQARYFEERATTIHATLPSSSAGGSSTGGSSND